MVPDEYDELNAPPLGCDGGCSDVVPSTVTEQGGAPAPEAVHVAASLIPETTTSVEVLVRRSAKPDGAGNVVMSTIRKRSRVTAPPVLLMTRRRMSSVPKVELLAGSEVKSIRAGGLEFKDAYVEPRGSEMLLVGCRIAPYSHGNLMNHAPDRSRKLLLHKREIERILARVREKGLTLVPTRMYFKGPHAKVELSLAKGKDVHDKRESIKEREVKREMDRAMGRRR